MITAGVGALVGNLLAGAVVGRAGDTAGVFVVPFAVNAILLVAWVGLARRASHTCRSASVGTASPTGAMAER